MAGLAAFKSHLSYLPHSGSVLSALSGKTVGYSQTKSALHFPLDEPLPQELVSELIEVKLRERGRDPHTRGSGGEQAQGTATE